jgi:hypothetical protein
MSVYSDTESVASSNDLAEQPFVSKDPAFEALRTNLHTAQQKKAGIALQILDQRQKGGDLTELKRQKKKAVKEWRTAKNKLIEYRNATDPDFKKYCIPKSEPVESAMKKVVDVGIEKNLSLGAALDLCGSPLFFSKKQKRQMKEEILRGQMKVWPPIPIQPTVNEIVAEPALITCRKCGGNHWTLSCKQSFASAPQPAPVAPFGIKLNPDISPLGLDMATYWKKLTEAPATTATAKTISLDEATATYQDLLKQRANLDEKIADAQKTLMLVIYREQERINIARQYIPFTEE